MNINSAFPSKYLRAVDLAGQDRTLVMRGVKMEAPGDDGDEKPVLYFEGEDRGLVLNKTNANTIVGLYGAETKKWAGKGITLFPSQTEFQGKSVACIRVRIDAPSQVSSGVDESDIPF